MRDQAGKFTAGHCASPRTQIRPGQRLSPATEIAQGERRSPATEFQKGRAARNKLPVGSETVRYDATSNQYRAWVKIADPNIWSRRAVVVWERANGPVPRGSLVHHRDHDTLNDSIDNLELMTRAEHRREHHDEIERARRAALEAT